MDDLFEIKSFLQTGLEYAAVFAVLFLFSGALLPAAVQQSWDSDLTILAMTLGWCGSSLVLLHLYVRLRFERAEDAITRRLAVTWLLYLFSAFVANLAADDFLSAAGLLRRASLALLGVVAYDSASNWGWAMKLVLSQMRRRRGKEDEQ